LQDKASKLESELDSAKYELRTHERQIGQLGSDIDQANFRIGANEQRIADLRRYIGDIEAKIDSMKGEINRLNDKIERIPRDIEHYHREASELAPGDPDARADKEEAPQPPRSEEHTSELQSPDHLV